MTATTCPCCGAAVLVRTADEGTCSYEPAVSAATIETVREKALRLRENACDHGCVPCRNEAEAILDALPPKADGPASEPLIRTIGDLTRAMTEAGLDPPDECA